MPKGTPLLATAAFFINFYKVYIVDLDVIRICFVEVNTCMDEMQEAKNKDQLAEAYEAAKEALYSLLNACEAKFE